MGLPGFARATAQIVRAGQTNDHGTLRTDWSAATTISVSGCSFQPAIGNDDVVHRQAVGGPAQLFMPPGTDVRGLDRILFAGKTYEIVGEPQVWVGPSPRTSYVAVNLHIWEG